MFTSDTSQDAKDHLSRQVEPGNMTGSEVCMCVLELDMIIKAIVNSIYRVPN